MADDQEGIASHLRIQGKLQGVFFRRWVVQEATRRGIRGWVRNRADGSVEAVLSGETAAVRGMVKACQQGPPAAEVSEVAQTPSETHPTEDDFGETFRQLPDL